MSTTRLLFIHALSPLHAGTGQGVGVIDLPIARETATGLPYLPGSSIKGTLRDSGAISDNDKQVIFGPDTEYASDNAGSAQFADARLLLLPVRSLAGTFAWVTSPYILRRFARDAVAADVIDLSIVEDWNKPDGDAPEHCKVAQGSALKLLNNTVVLEDLDLEADVDATVTALATALGNAIFPGTGQEAAYWRTTLTKRICVVRDDVMTFLLNTATEVIARIRLQDDTKTVDQGALWYEEALPTETVLVSLVVASPVATSKYRQRQNGVWSSTAQEKTITTDEVFAKLRPATDQALQFGGKATVGRGLCRVVLAQEVQHANS